MTKWRPSIFGETFTLADCLIINLLSVTTFAWRLVRYVTLHPVIKIYRFPVKRVRQETIIWQNTEPVRTEDPPPPAIRLIWAHEQMQHSIDHQQNQYSSTASDRKLSTFCCVLKVSFFITYRGALRMWLSRVPRSIEDTVSRTRWEWSAVILSKVTSLNIASFIRLISTNQCYCDWFLQSNDRW